MFNKITTTLTSVTVVAVLGMGVALAQAPKEKKVKDQGEFDLFTQASPATTTDPNKRLAALNSWKEKYPDSDFKDDRLKIYLTTYQALGQPVKMWETSKEMLALDPKEINALYWLTLLTETLPPSPDTLSTGEKAAQGLLDVPKPDAVKDEDFKKMKTDFAAAAHKTLGFIAVQKKQFDVAEREYAKSLEANPIHAQVSYSLGSAILAQKKPERYPEALFHIARAASLTGTGALPPALQGDVDKFLIKSYSTYHGSQDGLKELRQLAVGPKPAPPDGFTIKDVNSLTAEKEAEFAKSNPQLHFWRSMKDALKAENGQQYFEGGVKNASIPPENVAKKLKGKLVSMKPAVRPNQLVLAIEEGKPEVTLKLETPLAGKAEPGTELEFEGVAESFTAEPFMLTLTVDDNKAKISGWPAQAAAPAAPRKTGTTKKAAPKK